MQIVCKNKQSKKRILLAVIWNYATKYFVLQAECPSLLVSRNQTHTACRTLGMEFKENLSNGSRVSSEKIILQAMCPSLQFLHNQTCSAYRAQKCSDRCGVLEKSHQWKSSNTRETTLFFKMSFIIAYPQPNLHRFLVVWQVWSFRTIPLTKAELHPRRHFVLQTTCLSLQRSITTILTLFV